jgi:hypothetical protein
MLANCVSTWSLAQHDRAALVQANNVERVLPDIDADHGDRGLHCLKHSVPLGSVPSPAYLLTGQEHGRTIPLADIVWAPVLTFDKGAKPRRRRRSMRR